MSTIATGGIELTDWHEQPLARYDGGIEGRGAVEFLLAYKADGTAEFVGLQRVEGRVGERAGAMMLRVTGSIDATQTRADWRVVRDAGSGELRRTAGEGGFHAPAGRAGRYRLECGSPG